MRPLLLRVVALNAANHRQSTRRNAPAKRRSMAACQGFTIVEVLLALSLSAVLAAALGFTFSAAFRLQKSHTDGQAAADQTGRLEQEITRIIRGAKLTSTATDTASFFQGVNSGGETDLGCDRLTLTTTAPGTTVAAQTNTTDDFETQQTMYGPVGGVSEISLSTTAVGDAGSHTGLFERRQTPSDGDPTQGGTESVLDSDIDQIGFQFWNGTQYQTTWDTTAGDRRLPASVQVSYRLKNDPEQIVHMFVVAIPASDVTALNPDSAQGGT